MDVDSALAVVGGYRKWHLASFVLISIGLCFPLCWNSLGLIFMGWESKHACNVNVTNVTIHFVSSTEHFEHILFENISKISRKCYEFVPVKYQNSTEFVSFIKQPCKSGWKYENHGYSTTTEEWDLVCDRNYLSELSQVFLQVGCLIGDATLSYLIDAHGRRSIFAISHGLLILVGTASAFTSSYITFAITRIFIGILSSGTITSGKMLSLEFFDSKHRALPGIGGQVFWTIGHLSLGGIAYYVTRWRTLQLVISSLSGVFFIVCFFLPESPMWLATKGKFEKSENVLRNIARWNGVQLDPSKKLLSKSVISIHTSERHPPSKCDPIKPGTTLTSNHSDIFHVQLSPNLESQQTTGKFSKCEPSPTAKDFFTNSLLLKFLFSSSLLWFASLFLVFGLAFTTPSLAGDRFLNYFILGVFELPSPIVAAYLSERLGRRWSTLVFQLIGGCCISVVALIKIFQLGVSHWIIIVFVMSAKFFIFASFSVAILYTKEFFPTNFRATTTGICQIWGRVGAISASFASYLIKLQLTWAPEALFGVVSIAAGLSVFLLPETKGSLLPETIEDCRALKK